MQLFYNGFAIHNLGEFTVSQSREIEEGQRTRVTLRVTVTVFQRSYADNYALVQNLLAALQTQEAVLQWTNTDNGVDYVNQTVTQVSNDLPETWGTYEMPFNLTFFYYEQNLVTNNLPLTYAPNSGTPALELGYVMKFATVASTERMSVFQSPRRSVRAKVTVSGYLLGDPTVDLADRRTALIEQKLAMDEALNDSDDGVLQFGQSGAVFNQVVRPEEFSSEIDELKYQIAWSFTASYTLFPNEATMATTEYSAEQRDANTGEQFLLLTGKITAVLEATARTQLAAVIAAATKQYGYDVNSQQLRNDSKPELYQANSDGNGFIELSFTVEYRRFRTDNLQMTFLATGHKAQPVPFGNVVHWDLDYSARRFNDMRSQRSRAGGTVYATGTWLGDPKLTLAQLRTQLLAMQTAMLTEVNNADGTLSYGSFTQVGRVEDLKAQVNQALTGIDWSLTFVWSLFPNESGYATTEFTVEKNSNVETGDVTLAFAGRILAPDAALANAKLASLRTTILAQYGFTIDEQIDQRSRDSSVYANGDTTQTLQSAGLEPSDGTTYLELSFSENYRQRTATLIGFKLQQSCRKDVTTGQILTTYSGSVQAGGPVNAAYIAALNQAKALGEGRETQLGPTAFMKSSQVTWDQRMMTANSSIEFVSLTFSYEYQSRFAAGNAYVEVATNWSLETFGNDSVQVSGFVVATTNTAANTLYLNTVKAAYAGMIINGESTRYSAVTANADGTSPVAQDVRFDFSFAAFVPKAAGVVTYRYAIDTSNDYLQLERHSKVSGSVFAVDVTTAQKAVTALLAGLSLGSLVADSNRVDREYTSLSTLDVMLKYDFESSFVQAITGIANLLEMKVTETVKYSGTRWVQQPTLPADDGSGGYTIVQNTGIEAGSRTVRGSVTASSQATATGWARQQRALLTGDKNGNSYRQPEELENDYEFVPRLDGVITGKNANVRMYRVSFTFGEILPNYAPPQ